MRDNIIGEDIFEESSWYNKVIWSCSLTQDLNEMKEGDLTLVGSKGDTLSGGQKNRISLARALYTRKPILVIDDMLAGLDSASEKLVFDRVFGHNGLLRKSNATVILATHATYFARYADKVMVLSEGRIIEYGTFQELMAKQVNLHEINQSFEDDVDERDSIEEISPSTSFNVASPVLQANLVEEEEEDAARQAGDRKSLFFYLNSIGVFHCLLYFSSLVATIVVTTVQILWPKWWAQATDLSRSASIRNLYLFVVITLANIVVYFLWLM